jgi:uncharacterized protein
MRLRFRPEDKGFYSMFTAASGNIVEAAEQLLNMIVQDVDRTAVAAQIKDIEHAGDEVTHEIMHRLNSTFVTPFDREDIQALAGRLDDVVDHIEAAADLLVLYGVGEVPMESKAMADLLVRAAHSTRDAMPSLRGLKGLEEYWIEVNELENEADQLYRRLLRRLFSGEYKALTVMKLKEFADELEAAADAFEDVASTVQTIVVKES